MSEQEFIQKLQAGDRTALKTLYEDNKSAVLNVCFRMLNDQREAEEVTQEVFFRAYKNLKKFRGGSRLSTWLYRIAINLCLNHQKRKKRSRWLSLDVLLESENERLPVGSGSSPDMEIEKVEMQWKVQQAINSLPKRQRIALILHRYEGLSHEKIAATMQCSIASVESLIFRAKRNLYDKLLPVIEDL